MQTTHTQMLKCEANVLTTKPLRHSAPSNELTVQFCSVLGFGNLVQIFVQFGDIWPWFYKTKIFFFLCRCPIRSWEEKLWLCLFMITIVSPSTTSLVKSNCPWTQWIWDSPLRNGKTWIVLRRKRWTVWCPSFDLIWNSYNEIEMKPRYYYFCSFNFLYIHHLWQS